MIRTLALALGLLVAGWTLAPRPASAASFGDQAAVAGSVAAPLEPAQFGYGYGYGPRPFYGPRRFYGRRVYRRRFYGPRRVYRRPYYRRRFY